MFNAAEKPPFRLKILPHGFDHVWCALNGGLFTADNLDPPDRRINRLGFDQTSLPKPLQIGPDPIVQARPNRLRLVETAHT